MVRGSRRVVTETLDFDGGRAVSAYVPAAEPTAMLLAGDGQLLAPWGADLEAAGLPPTLVVAAHRHPDEVRRVQEYSPGRDTPDFTFDPARFAAHDRFVTGPVLDWARTRFGVDLPPTRTAAFGVSAGAELALALGLRHPDLVGAVLAASPGGGFRPPDDLHAPLPRAYLVAGDQEPFFSANATRWADALRAAGADVLLERRAGSHGGPFWRAELPRMVAWAFAQPAAR